MSIKTDIARTDKSIVFRFTKDAYASKSFSNFVSIVFPGVLFRFTKGIYVSPKRFFKIAAKP